MQLKGRRPDLICFPCLSGHGPTALTWYAQKTRRGKCAQPRCTNIAGSSPGSTLGTAGQGGFQPLRSGTGSLPVCRRCATSKIIHGSSCRFAFGVWPDTRLSPCDPVAILKNASKSMRCSALIAKKKSEKPRLRICCGDSSPFFHAGQAQNIVFLPLHQGRMVPRGLPGCNNRNLRARWMSAAVLRRLRSRTGSALP